MTYKTKLDVVTYESKLYVSVENLIEFWAKHYKGNFVNVDELVESLVELNYSKSKDIK